MPRLGLALTLAAALASTSFVAQAQTAVFAIATPTFTGPDFSVDPPFLSPFRATADGFEIKYAVLCVDRAADIKRTAEVVAVIPDGSTLAQIRTITTTAVVDGCLAFSISVPRTNVMLPAVQAGQ